MMSKQVVSVSLPKSGTRQELLLAARHLVNQLVAEGYALHRGEHFRRNGGVYFELDENAKLTAIAERVAQLEPDARVELATSRTEDDACANCGNIADEPIVTCPACAHREIDPCPHCGNEVPREHYIPVAGTLVVCPKCRTRVRLELSDPLWREDGLLAEPIVHVYRELEESAHV
ncbi:MAG: hypothetical protein RBU37_25035 [Myxococcota bacterium]|jgi:DNA-directed RNA polymerase subunit RPC12/RpoP|nr:hypothetical protein [Myxococcota bacterium]